MDAVSVDAVVTDPPYELGFMGKAWDASGVAFQVETWEAVLRVLKPGGHLLAFGGTRTYHRMTCAIEDAGFEIRDCLQWIYGSGFPKSLDVSKAIDKAAGAEREVIGRRTRPDGSAPRCNVVASKYSGTAYNGGSVGGDGNDGCETAPATVAAQQWQGWGTSLKPAHEPIVLARKPLIGTVAANVQAYGTGAINVDGCRIGSDGGGWNGLGHTHDESQWRLNQPDGVQRNLGRWPANVLHDGSEDVLAGFPQSVSGGYPPGGGLRSHVSTYGEPTVRGEQRFRGSDGSAARFFYCAKASRKERGEGNTHPTVKPLALMRYLVRLITPPDGLVLDPFAGSGTTGIAAIREGARFIGIEQSAEYAALAERRIQAASQLPIEAA
jgi:DNA modification methylase